MAIGEIHFLPDGFLKVGITGIPETPRALIKQLRELGLPIDMTWRNGWYYILEPRTPPSEGRYVTFKRGSIHEHS